MTQTGPQLPPFKFPVVAWAPEPATGDPFDDGVREILGPRELTTIYFPKTDLRRNWTFVDSDGRSWEATSTRVVGRADAWWMRALPSWLHPPKYRLAYEFEARPPVSFDKVKTRLFASVTANPQAFQGGYGSSRRAELRAARSLSDLIKSDEALAIERLAPEAWWWQWLLGEGRCSRLGFVAQLAGLLGLWSGVIWLGVTTATAVTMFIVSLVVVISGVVRRLHDLRLSGWWTLAWWGWVLGCLWLTGVVHAPVARSVIFWSGWISTTCLFGCLVLWPGTQGPNRYGFAPFGGRLRRAAPGGGGA